MMCGMETEEGGLSHTQLTFEHAQGVLLTATQRAIESVSVGLRGLEAAGSDRTLPTAKIKITVTAIDQPEEEKVADLRARILAGGLRDCVDAIGVALVWAYRECQLWNQPGTITERDGGILHLNTTFSGGWWNKTMVAGAERFDRLTLPDKVDRLEQIGMARPAFTDYMFSLNAARNCLIHRAGMVGPKDLRDPADHALEVTWTRFKITASNDTDSREIGIGSQVEKGEVVSIEVAPTSRSFALGERVTFTEDDFSEIAQTFMFYANQVQGSIVAMQRRLFEAQATDPAAGAPDA